MYQKIFDLIKSDIEKRSSCLVNNNSLHFIKINSYSKIMFLLEVKVDVLINGENRLMIYTYDLLNDTHLRLEDIV